MWNSRFIFGSQIQEYYVNKIREINRIRDEKIAALQTCEDAENYVAGVREAIKNCFPLPEHNPENIISRSVAVVEQADFFMEKVIYESRPDFPVTANLYLPKTPGRHPGVVFVCGHSKDGKACPVYRAGAASLAAKGFVVLLLDPIAQGERDQFIGIAEAKDLLPSCVYQHNMTGKQLQLTGETFGAWRAWDAIRGLDYLLTRPEVDPERIGITGNSGGGTMTSLVQALDPRFTMAAPSCYITSWQRNLENELPADIEQIPPGICAAGCEMGDLILAYAPRPVLLLGQKNDFFDPRGLKKTYEQLKYVYKLLGYENNIRCFIGPVDHGYSIENREAMYEFFMEHAKVDAPVKEPDNAGSKIDTNCTATGQVMSAMPEKKTVHDFAVEIAEKIAAGRPALTVDELKSAIRKSLNIPEKVSAPYVRMLRPVFNSELLPSRQFLNRFGLEVEPGLIATLKLCCKDYFFHFPEIDNLQLYIPHLDAGTEVVQLPVIDNQFRAALDIRGVGESQSACYDQYIGSRAFTAPYSTEYHIDSCGLLFGESLLGRRTFDVLSAIAFAKASGTKNIALCGRGMGSLPALLAALLSDEVNSLTLYDAPRSWMSMIQKTVTAWPQSAMPFGILKIADLPEIRDAVESVKPLETVSFAEEPMPETQTLN